MNITLKGLVLVAALLNVNSAIAGFYSQKLYNFDHNQCEEEELSLVIGKFASEFGVEVIAAHCGSKLGDLTDLSIDYIADARVANQVFPSATTFPFGRFENYEDCRASLANDAGRFSFETGVEPWYVWCGLDITSRSRDDGSYGVFYSIKKQPMRSQPRVASILISSVGRGEEGEEGKREQIAGQVRQMLDNNLVNYYSVQIKKSGTLFHSNIVIHYYSNERMDIGSNYEYKIDEEARCDALAQAFNAKLQLRGVRSSTSFCIEGPFKGEFEVNHVFLGRRLHSTHLLEGFDKESECVEKKQELTELAERKYGDRFVVGECSRVVEPGLARFGYLASFITF